MATRAVSAVDVYPELRDPDLRSFSDAADAVCSLYSDAVRPARLAARASLFRMTLFRVDHGSAVRLRVYDDVPDAEIGNVMVPSGVARLPAPVVALLVLDVVHAAMTELGRLRGWDRAVLDGRAPARAGRGGGAGGGRGRRVDHEDQRRRVGALLHALGDRLPAGVTAGLGEWLAEGMTPDCVGALFHQVRSNGIALSPAEERELHELGRLQVHGRDRWGTAGRRTGVGIVHDISIGNGA